MGFQSIRGWMLLLLLGLAVSCARPGSTDARPPGGNAMKAAAATKLHVHSTAFAEGAMIPRPYTCDGRNVSPPLSWSGVPAGAHSLALICEDPDAPGGAFHHWVLYNLPARVRALEEGVPAEATLANGARQGTNDFGNLGWSGPCPPGGVHRYYFRLYALDAALDPPASPRADQLQQAMRGHVVAQGELMGRYRR